MATMHDVRLFLLMHAFGQSTQQVMATRHKVGVQCGKDKISPPISEYRGSGWYLSHEVFPKLVSSMGLGFYAQDSSR